VARRLKAVSPILGATAAAIGDASRSLVSAGSEFNHSFEVDFDAVTPDPAQPRRAFDETALAALGETLRSEGQLQPILVRKNPERKGGWVIVAGERRWRAAAAIGWTRMLAIEVSGDAEVATLLENLQRVDLSPVEEARGIRRLVDGKGWTQDRAAKALGMTKAEVSGTLRILRLPEEVLASVLTSEHPATKNVLTELSRIDDDATLARLLSLAAEGGLTVKAIRTARESAASVTKLGDGIPATKKGRDAWSSVGRVAQFIVRLTTAGARVDKQRANSLTSLREAIDALLSQST
jgi:ParB family chromosome partitioning protein